MKELIVREIFIEKDRILITTDEFTEELFNNDEEDYNKIVDMITNQDTFYFDDDELFVKDDDTFIINYNKIHYYHIDLFRDNEQFAEYNVATEKSIEEIEDYLSNEFEDAEIQISEIDSNDADFRYILFTHLSKIKNELS